MRRVLIITAITTFAASNPVVARAQQPNPKADAILAEMLRLRGKWIPSASENEGVAVAPDQLEGRSILITDDTLCEPKSDHSLDTRYSIDPTVTPRAVDLVLNDGPDKGKTRLGIYHCDNNRLRLCLSPPGSANRPVRFETGGTRNSSTTYQLQYQLPPGWKEVSDGPGVEFFRRGYHRDTIYDYVAAIDLRRATLRSAVGSPFTKTDDPIGLSFVEGYWNAALDRNTDHRKLKAIINGTFFESRFTDSRISYGLKKDGTLYSLGAAVDRNATAHPQLVTFAFGERSARIDPWARSTFEDPKFVDVVGAIGPDCPNKPEAGTGRTLVGLRDSDGDGLAETVLFFVTALAVQRDAITNLSEFGVVRKDIAMMDGGGSSRLILDGEKRVTTIDITRRFPHVFSIYMGK